MPRLTRFADPSAVDPLAPHGLRAAIGLPARIVYAEGLAAQAATRHGACALDLSRTGSLPAGAWVLALRGAARAVIDSERAREIDATLDLLDAVARGELDDTHTPSSLAGYLAALHRKAGTSHLE